MERRRVTILRLARHGNLPLEILSAEQLADWYRGLGDRLNAGSRATELSHVVAYYRWLVRAHHRLDDPTAELDRPKVHRRLPRPIADEALALALDGAPERLRPWLFLAAFEGLRACEVANLRREDVLDESHPPVLIVTAGKGDKQRVLPLHESVAAVLPLERTGWLFPRRDGRPGPVGANTVSKLSCIYLRSLGVKSTFHALRHWFGTQIYRQSLDLRLTQELMGHSDPATTAGYAAWAPERAAGVVGALHVAARPLDETA